MIATHVSRRLFVTCLSIIFCVSVAQISPVEAKSPQRKYRRNFDSSRQGSGGKNLGQFITKSIIEGIRSRNRDGNENIRHHHHNEPSIYIPYPRHVRKPDHVRHHQPVVRQPIFEVQPSVPIRQQPPVHVYVPPIRQHVEQPIALPRSNKLPVFRAKPKLNKFNSSFEMANQQQLTEAADNFDNAAREEAADLQNTQNNVVDSKAQELANSTPMTPAQKKAFSEAVANGDVNTMTALMATVKPAPDQSKVDALISSMNTSNDINDLANMIDSGATAQEIEVQTQNIAQQLRTQLATTPQSGLMIGQLESLQTTLLTRDVLDDIAANGNQPTFPDGLVNIVCVPALPEGAIAVSPDGYIVQGTGGTGELTITEGTSSDVLGIGTPDGEVLPNLSQNISGSSEGIVLHNSESTQMPIHFTIDGHAYEIEPGFIQRLNGNSSMTIVFDRGGDFGIARYTLTKGSYEFSATENGWELHSKKFTVSLDNTDNVNPFYYVINGVQAEMAAGDRTTHTMDYPVIIEFDSGDGTGPVRKELESGSYRVGLDFSNSRIDIFDAKKSALTSTNTPARVKSTRRRSKTTESLSDKDATMFDIQSTGRDYFSVGN